VDELAAAHGGTVAVAASPLGGARVEVRLPRLNDPGD
jgi:signal transduction histidine kinase